MDVMPSRSSYHQLTALAYAAAIAAAATGAHPAVGLAQTDGTARSRLPQLTEQEFRIFGKPWGLTIKGGSIKTADSGFTVNGQPITLDSTGKAIVKLPDANRTASVLIGLDPDGLLSIQAGQNRASFGYGTRLNAYAITLAPPSETAVQAARVQDQLTNIQDKLRRRPAQLDSIQAQADARIQATLSDVSDKLEAIKKDLSARP